MSESSDTGQIGLMAPDDWFEIDIDPETSADSIRAICDRQLGPTPAEQRTRSELEATLRFVAARCAEVGAIAAMGYADVIDEEPYYLTASMTLAMVDTDQEAVSVADVEREMSALGYELTAFELPIGPALVATGRTMESVPGFDDQIEIYSQRYYVPLPDTTSIAVLSFVTPTIPLIDEFDGLFEAIAETLYVSD